MARTNKSARNAGSSFERAIANYLAKHVDDRIDRRVKTGAKDKGDIAGVRHLGGRVVIEAKNVSRMSLSAWVKEAEVERGNDDADIAVVAHKRHGVGAPGEQYVTMTLANFARMLGGEIPHE